MSTAPTTSNSPSNPSTSLAHPFPVSDQALDAVVDSPIIEAETTVTVETNSEDACERIRRAIESALHQRARTYERIVGLFVRFEADDSKAEDDIAGLKQVLERLVSLDVEEVVIPTSEAAPAWYLSSILDKVTQKFLGIHNRGLIIFVYVGHGSVNDLGKLTFCASSTAPRTFPWHLIDEKICHPTVTLQKEALRSVDVVALVDSCSAGTASKRTLNEPGRTVELLTAVDSSSLALGNNSYNVRRQNNTFSAIVSNALAQLLRGNEETFSFHEIFQTVHKRSTVCIPSFINLEGTIPIRVPIARNKSSIPFGPGAGGVATKITLDKIPEPSELPVLSSIRASFYIHLDNNIREERLQNLVAWILSLDKSFTIELLSVNPAASKYLLLDAPLNIYGVLAEFQHVKLNYIHHGVNEIQTFKEKSKVPVYDKMLKHLGTEQVGVSLSSESPFHKLDN